MSDYRFYDDYQPSETVRARLGRSPSDDIARKVPYRDVLGVLEAEDAHPDGDRVSAEEIRTKIEDWCNKEQLGTRTPPESVRTVQYALDELVKKGIVKVDKSEGNRNMYYKLPDDEIGSPVWNQIVQTVSSVHTTFEYVVSRNGYTLLGISICGTAGFLLFLFYSFLEAFSMTIDGLSQLGARLWITGFFLVVFGHSKEIVKAKIKQRKD